MEDTIMNIITAHNRVIGALRAAKMTCDLFSGMSIWHELACEGAKITHAAREVGITAVVDMQTGRIRIEEDD